ncbi:DUF3984 domain-containing protein [Aspergillus candidus]|uniref:Uncharacterized protein n=1 Tax=Aspergillus candidus TaxID=41067 RepID=A0A2I2FE61_ASPCN|nr:hypothetical protein BDW47DRAFT_103941 [Aspergillus candidus]PLB38923.1 hypothetical protein BDW47DRAFT_103941 [Aspergillus candidus]
MEPPSQNSFRSRRSYPSLKHVSITPLTPRFPIDGDDDDHTAKDVESAGDYFSPRDETPGTPTTSYLASYSVPSTPGVLSSRSPSRPRHHTRSKSASRRLAGDNNLEAQDANQPLHPDHHRHHHRRHSSKMRSSQHHHHQSDTDGRRDAEWMLRAGIALASSTREEKGQSWLAKRESSTSLLADGNNLDIDAPTSKPRSGRTTPAAFSRRGSRSRPISRRNSRPDLSMTTATTPGLEMTAASSPSGPTSAARDHQRPLSGGGHTPRHSDPETRHFVPDFVDERIRAEMETLQRDRWDEYSSSNGSPSSSVIDSDDSDPDDSSIDEEEMQRLTRERGFGLGNWFDRMVEWTVFGVDEWPDETLSKSAADGQKSPVDVHNDNAAAADDEDDSDDDDGASLSNASESEMPVSTEKADASAGGWQDAGWLLRAMRRSFF